MSILFISFFNNEVIIYKSCSSLLFFDRIFSYKLLVKKCAKHSFTSLLFAFDKIFDTNFGCFHKK